MASGDKNFKVEDAENLYKTIERLLEKDASRECADLLYEMKDLCESLLKEVLYDEYLHKLQDTLEI